MYKIITDSCCDLPNQIIQEEKIDFISFEVIINDEVFLDNFNDTNDINLFYEKLRDGAKPTTSQVNVSKYVDFFLPYIKTNIPILYICFSSGLSGSYNSALLAAEMIREDYPKAEIYVLDSLAASGGQGLMVLDAFNNYKNGLSFKENIDWLENKKKSYQHWAIVNDLEHLYRGGRLSKSSALIGEALSVKPILNINENGKLFIHNKVRTKKRALRYIAEKVVDTLNINSESNNQTVIITHSGDIENALLVKNLILKHSNPKQILICNLGATISSHTGYGCIIAFVKDSP